MINDVNVTIKQAKLPKISASKSDWVLKYLISFKWECE